MSDLHLCASREGRFYIKSVLMIKSKNKPKCLVKDHTTKEWWMPFHNKQKTQCWGQRPSLPLHTVSHSCKWTNPYPFALHWLSTSTQLDFSSFVLHLSLCTYMQRQGTLWVSWVSASLCGATSLAQTVKSMHCEHLLNYKLGFYFLKAAFDEQVI